MKIIIRTLLVILFLALMTSAYAQTLTIQSIPAADQIELSDSGIWQVVPITYPNIPCMSCYIQQHWIEGDIVELLPKNGNYGAYTHTMGNYKDHVKANIIRVN